MENLAFDTVIFDMDGYRGVNGKSGDKKQHSGMNFELYLHRTVPKKDPHYVSLCQNIELIIYLID